jgi:molybdopterin-guanine dinucleotide biosynthesis protein A
MAGGDPARTGLKAGVAAYILAGGASSRMGRDKALIGFGGMPLVLHIAALAEPFTGLPTIVGPPERYAKLNLRVVADDAPGLGPLGGIATALRDTRAEWNLILGCDLPFLTSEWLKYLIDRALRSAADAVLPHGAAGAEPLCAMYQKRCEMRIVDAITRGVRRVTDGLVELDVERIVPEDWKAFDTGGLLFKNMNSAKDLEEISAALERKYGRVAGK